MHLNELTTLLEHQPKSKLQFVLPHGEAVPAHFHLTEVGLIRKTFVDCGGTQRSAESCLLQLWTANDFEHRLDAGKLLQILKLAAPILQSDNLPIEIEYGQEVAATYTIGDSVSAFDVMRFNLVGKRTDCLAKDKCGIPGSSDSSSCC